MSDFDEDPIPFGEAFGVNPDGTPYVAPEAEEADEPEEEPVAEEEAPAEEAPEDDTDAADAAIERLYAGKYKSVEELEKAHRELTRAWDSRGPAQPAAQPTPEPQREAPSPLLAGDVAEIKTQADLYKWAEADPEAAANWAMQNHTALKQEQLDMVMNNWIATQPWRAITTVQQWNAQLLREEWEERQAVQDAAYTNSIRGQGLAMAAAEEPLMVEYQHELGEFIRDRPQLNALVEAARTPDELKDALVSSFYAMAGPQIAKQAMQARVQAQLAAEQAAAAEAEAEAKGTSRASKARTISRNTAPPPEGEADQDEAIRQFVLEGGRPRR